MRYYFAITALPPLSIGSAPALSFKEVREMLSLNLKEGDAKKVTALLRSIDLYNLRALWLGLPLDKRGNLEPRELEEAFLVPNGFPTYLADFLDRYEETPERLRYFPALYASLYREPEAESPFLRKYYQLEREMRLVLSALRAKQSGRDLVYELQFEDPLDPFIAEILAQKDSSEYNPSREYEDLKFLFTQNVSEPQELNRALLAYKFRKIEELEEGENFTIDQILGYLARLLLVENFSQLDYEKGRIVVEELSDHG